MLQNAGYFRGINCPSLIKEGKCDRPFCHFRHKIPTKNGSITDNLQAVNHIDSDQNEAPTYVPAKIGSTSNSSVLHGAKGSALSLQNTFKSSVKYDLSSAAKPVDDLEYDPMCNFNLKKEAAKKKADHQNESIDADVVDLTREESSDVTRTDGEDSQDLCNLKKNFGSASDSSAKRTELPSKLYIPSKSSQKTFPIVIIDSDDDSVEEKPFVSLKSSEEPKFSKMSLESDLFGTDSENDTTVSKCDEAKSLVSTKNTSIKASPNVDSIKSKETPEKAKMKKEDKLTKKVSSTSKLSTKKSKSKTPSKEKVVKPLSDSINKKKELKKRKSDLKLSPLKRKKPKLSDSAKFNSPTEIEKYVSKDEIEKLDKELLNDVGMYDECYRIYQETMDSGMTTDQNPIVDDLPSMKPAKVFKASLSATDECNVTSNSPGNSFIPEKSRRVAHSAADLSARNLNRDRKQAKRILTPSQIMMQRMETIQREQEERILSSVTKKSSTIKSSASVSSKLSQSSRIAHQPSTSLNKKPSSDKKSSPSLLSEFYKKRKPFEDLRSKSSSSTYVQSTIPKGFGRKAHAPTENLDDAIEKPTIVPDRHSKVPTNIRQRYLTVFIDECLRIFGNNRMKAYETAKIEEQQCNARSKSKAIYLSLAASTLKRLRNQIAEDFQAQNKTLESIALPLKSVKTSPVKVAFKTNSIRIAHNTSPTKAASVLSKKMTPKAKRKASVMENNHCQGGFSIVKEEKHNSLSDKNLYENLRRYLLTNEDLCVNGFPRPGELPGSCSFAVEKPKPASANKRTCARCGKEFFMTKKGHFFADDDECIHHWGKAYPTKVGSHWEKRYTCCQTPSGSEGCSVGDTHVHKENTYSCSGYVQTLKKTNDSGNPGIYALDCEMAFTVEGLELIRVSVVNFNGKLVYDTLVKPEGKILDYNTRWSGLTADDLKGAKTTLQDVHAALLTKFSADTILIGHSLESDLVALRLIHSSVIDTSVAFPHRLGLPYKRALRTLMAENLGIIIQNSVDEGHDSMEDALACIKLMKWKLGEDSKLSSKSMQQR